MLIEWGREDPHSKALIGTVHKWEMYALFGGPQVQHWWWKRTRQWVACVSNTSFELKLQMIFTCTCSILSQLCLFSCFLHCGGGGGNNGNGSHLNSYPCLLLSPNSILGKFIHLSKLYQTIQRLLHPGPALEVTRLDVSQDQLRHSQFSQQLRDPHSASIVVKASMTEASSAQA